MTHATALLARPPGAQQFRQVIGANNTITIAVDVCWTGRRRSRTWPPSSQKIREIGGADLTVTVEVCETEVKFVGSHVHDTVVYPCLAVNVHSIGFDNRVITYIDAGRVG